MTTQIRTLTLSTLLVVTDMTIDVTEDGIDDGVGDGVCTMDAVVSGTFTGADYVVGDKGGMYRNCFCLCLPCRLDNSHTLLLPFLFRLQRPLLPPDKLSRRKRPSLSPTPTT